MKIKIYYFDLLIGSFVFFFLHDMCSRRKSKSIQIASNILRHRNLSGSFLQFREGSYCPKRISFGLKKCNDMEYHRNYPVHISVMKFSTASFSTLKVTNQTRREEELSSLSSYDRQVRMMTHFGSCSYRLSKTPRRKLSGDRTGWAEAAHKLTQIKMEMLDLDKLSLYPSNTNTIASSIAQKPAITQNEGRNLMLHDLCEPASSSVQHSMLNNSMLLIDTERVGTESNVSSLKTGEEKIDGVDGTESNVSSLKTSEEEIDNVDGNHSLDAAAKDATKAKLTVRMIRSDEQSKLRERLCSIYEDILVVNNISHAEQVAKMLTVNYRHLIHACDTEVLLLTVLTFIMTVP